MGSLLTPQGSFTAGHIVNAAGLYADKIALDFGFSERYRILPFKGLYLYSDEPPDAFRTNIYPVPDLRNPFLGVHFTVKDDGHVKIGPTAIPAFWREQYRRFDNFKFGQFVELLFREAGLMPSSSVDFKKLALQEAQKYLRLHLVALASRLGKGCDPSITRDGASPEFARSYWLSRIAPDYTIAVVTLEERRGRRL
jgi:L-2-hydroxyglutarate oxidase LhgO